MIKTTTIICFLLFVWVNAQTKKAGCIEQPDSLSDNRVLLNKFREIYTDDVLKNWNFFNYNKVKNGLKKTPGVNGVKLQVKFVESGEYIDPHKGGVTEDNIKAGLDGSLQIARKMVPGGATVKPSLPPVTQVIHSGSQCGGGSAWYTGQGIFYKCGTGWGWNSVLYTKDGKLYEIVYFYHGYLGPGTGGSDNNDAQLFLVVNKEIEICPDKRFTYQVIRGE
ncbi:MAG: hypothetical protein HQK83_20305 [Fibrobacteria bacterium]|nr:hypothetical protein [Fibrobacteria bacterium]